MPEVAQTSAQPTAEAPTSSDRGRASVWDHCHEHGHVRGPVCPSCNTFEGKGG
ncbi:endonuclease domain-containing protein [Streptomyces prunicolor]